MPEYLAPGVYVEETSFRSKSIEGVSTTTTGFVGPARYGPTNGDPVLVTSLGEFAQTFGDGQPLEFTAGVKTTNYLWHAARAFFEEGGKRLYVARVFTPVSATDGGQAKKQLPADPASKVVQVQARYPGSGSALTVQFSLEMGQNAFSLVGTTNVFSTAIQDRDVVWIAPAAATSPPPPPPPPPPPGTPPPPPPAPPTNGKFAIASRDATTGAVTFAPALSGVPTDVRIVRVSVSTGLPGGRATQFSGLPLDPGHQSGGKRDSLFAVFSPNADDGTIPVVIQQAPPVSTPGSPPPPPPPVPDGIGVLKALFATGVTGLPANDGTTPLPARGGNVLGTATFTLEGGNDGALPDLAAYTGIDGNDPGTQMSGLKALETAEDISIVAAPGHTAKVYADSNAALPEAITRLLISHAERMRYRIAVLDGPEGAKLTDIRKYRAKLDSTYAALYYPWVTILDPITRVTIDLPPSGFVSGIYARNDSNFAVYKAPANEPVRLALGFAETVNQGRQEVLNPEGINCFRFFEGRGNLLWGARTISSDAEWKYVNLRRYFAYLERSIDRGSQFAVFMPNGERLWANVRRAVAEFLLNEWQSGALLGDRPEKAFFVRCDRTTMTQNDLDNGRLVCLVGVAPLRPAEFVVFRIGQWTGDSR